MTFSSSQNSVLLTQIVSQVENNIQFLVSQGYVAQQDASQFLAKLPHSDAPASVAAPSFPTPTPRAVASTPATTPRARVLWPWSGQVCLQINGWFAACSFQILGRKRPFYQGRRCR
jgi:hypothetical protein